MTDALGWLSVLPTRPPATPTDTRTAALAALRELVGRPDAAFHDGQFEAIEALVDGRRRALVLGVEYNTRLLAAIAEHVAPAIGWEPAR
ncbi:hypothetical protein EV187_3053 [Agromyces ramosus]|uniref:Uncharacterized protein n=1 Tax=Agromyces ramosus TaxID=33879 RepID=A0A4Q7M9N5_9MICO|nr:hypothetical protein [Agromyces ramosus]RZS64666.1 hypothetical protein EV187_3053 [Agromyces ramosus]